MGNIIPFVETGCGYLVPQDRECEGSVKIDSQQFCRNCPIYLENKREKKKSPFYTKKVCLSKSKTAMIFRHAFGVSVEAVV